MLITETNIDIWYREYLNQYEKTKKYVKSRGGKVRAIQPSSRNEFKLDFISSMNDNSKLSAKKIAQNLAKQELYEVSWKQAERYAKAHVEIFGGKVNMNLIQRYRMDAVNGENLWTTLERRRTELKRSGVSSYQGNLIIAQEFFGSE